MLHDVFEVGWADTLGKEMSTESLSCFGLTGWMRSDQPWRTGLRRVDGADGESGSKSSYSGVRLLGCSVFRSRNLNGSSRQLRKSTEIRVPELFI